MTKVEDAPSDFICPITHVLMRDPLMRRCGLTYERDAILSWLYEHNNACPITRDRLSPRDLVPNHALRGKIDAWLMINELRHETSTNDNDSGDFDEEARMDKILCTCLISSIDEHTVKSSRRKALSLLPATRPRRMLDTLRVRLGPTRA